MMRRLRREMYGKGVGLYLDHEKSQMQTANCIYSCFAKVSTFSLSILVSIIII